MSIIAEPTLTTPDTGKIDLVGMSRDDMMAEFDRLGLPAFRVKQVWHWIYHHGVRDFTEMTSIAKGMQSELAEIFDISRPGIATEQTSIDVVPKVAFHSGDPTHSGEGSAPF